MKKHQCPGCDKVLTILYGDRATCSCGRYAAITSPRPDAPPSHGLYLNANWGDIHRRRDFGPMPAEFTIDQDEETMHGKYGDDIIIRVSTCDGKVGISSTLPVDPDLAADYVDVYCRVLASSKRWREETQPFTADDEPQTAPDP